MEEIIDKNEGIEIIKALYRPEAGSHKGQNGKVMVIGGSHLFHAASLWALEVASRIVDMVFYSSVPENNEVVSKLKEEFHDGIVVPREDVGSYLEEAESVLIGPGMERVGETKELTEELFKKYPSKRWVVDAGALQMIDVNLIPKSSIITPHHQEFQTLFGVAGDKLSAFDASKKYGFVILLKGQEDVVCNSEKCVRVVGGNAGMTKGGTGDVLAGLVAAFYAKNNAFESAAGASFLNKFAGDRLYEKQNYMFNASDLASEIPLAYKDCLG